MQQGGVTFCKILKSWTKKTLFIIVYRSYIQQQLINITSFSMKINFLIHKERSKSLIYMGRRRLSIYIFNTKNFAVGSYF